MGIIKQSKEDKWLLHKLKLNASEFKNVELWPGDDEVLIVIEDYMNKCNEFFDDYNSKVDKIEKFDPMRAFGGVVNSLLKRNLHRVIIELSQELAMGSESLLKRQEDYIDKVKEILN